MKKTSVATWCEWDVFEQLSLDFCSKKWGPQLTEVSAASVSNGSQPLWKLQKRAMWWASDSMSTSFHLLIHQLVFGLWGNLYWGQREEITKTFKICRGFSLEVFPKTGYKCNGKGTVLGIFCMSSQTSITYATTWLCLIFSPSLVICKIVINLGTTSQRSCGDKIVSLFSEQLPIYQELC